MNQLAQWVLGVADAIGGPGLFLIAFVDASFLSLPQANDMIIVLKVAHEPHRMVYYATLATLGSVLGCFVIYALARKGGEALLRRKVTGERFQRVHGAFERWGVLALIVPALLPPPAPFKLFVLMAGVVEMSAPRFLLSLLVGRGIRYFGVGLLTVRYGEAAMDVLRTHGREAAYALAAVVALAVVAWVLLRRRGQPAAA